ncbi:hypothetical protein PISMIDRAFT_680598, partial [Pisolithus microcarpus 441]
MVKRAYHGLDRQSRIERGTRLPMGGGQEVKETAEKGGPLARLCVCLGNGRSLYPRRLEV